MSFETALRARLKNDTGIQSIGARIDWDERPQQSDLPAIVLETVSGSRDQHFKGVMTAQGDRIQATCIGMTKAQVMAMRDRVMAVFETPAEQDGITFQQGFVNLHRSGTRDTDTGVIHHAIVDADIWHN